jgi:hypothetical protein
MWHAEIQEQVTLLCEKEEGEAVMTKMARRETEAEPLV